MTPNTQAAEDAQRERQRREAMAARPPREKDLFAQ